MKVSLGAGTSTGIIASRCYDEECTQRNSWNLLVERPNTVCRSADEGQTDHNESDSCTFTGQTSLDMWGDEIIGEGEGLVTGAPSATAGNGFSSAQSNGIGARLLGQLEGTHSIILP
eukprot:scaffold13084_cov77-Skeletonema_dohrnii-CCMP3373.AAC.1